MKRTAKEFIRVLPEQVIDLGWDGWEPVAVTVFQGDRFSVLMVREVEIE